MPGNRRNSVVAFTLILSAPIAIGCVLLSLMAVHFDFGALDHPASSIGIGAQAAPLIYWSMICDLFGFYLLLAPAALLLRAWLRPKDDGLLDLYTLGGLGYVLIGSIGAAVLAAAWPPLIRSYAQAIGVHKQTYQIVFENLTNVVYGGMWNTLEMVLAGVWWFGVGRLLMRERKALGVATVVLGVAALIDAAGNLLGIPPMAALGLNVYLVLGPAWAAWLGISILRNPPAIPARAS